MKALITGGCGFVGSNLAAELELDVRLQDGGEVLYVVMVDRRRG